MGRTTFQNSCRECALLKDCDRELTGVLLATVHGTEQSALSGPCTLQEQAAWRRLLRLTNQEIVIRRGDAESSANSLIQNIREEKENRVSLGRMVVFSG